MKTAPSTVLWPDEGEQPWMAPFPLASRDLRQRRLLFLTRIFGDNDEEAGRLLRRMLLPGYWIATKLRAFDPEYLEGLLGFLPGDDARAWGFPRRSLRGSTLADEAAADSAMLLPWLARYRPELLTPTAAKIAAPCGSRSTSSAVGCAGRCAAIRRVRPPRRSSSSTCCR